MIFDGRWGGGAAGGGVRHRHKLLVLPSLNVQCRCGIKGKSTRRILTSPLCTNESAPPGFKGDCFSLGLISDGEQLHSSLDDETAKLECSLINGHYLSVKADYVLTDI